MSDWINMDEWYTVLPPSRPTIDELNRIKTNLEKVDRKEPIAVLGSTPEFRELLFELGFEHRYIIDKSEGFYIRMGGLIPSSVKKDEKFINGDWTKELSKCSLFFKAILSDLTMGNIPYNERNDFYSSIYNSLKYEGVFIDKVLAFDFEIPTLNELFAKYEQLPINLRTINDFSSEVLFCSELVKKDNIVDSTAFYNTIKEGEYSEKIKFFAEAAQMITPRGFIWSYGKPWSELEQEYMNKYSLQKAFPENDTTSPYYHRTKQIFNFK